MPRRTFLDILNSEDIDIAAEYRSLHSLFYKKHNEINSCFSLYEIINGNFTDLPMHGTCFTLDEFDERKGLFFIDVEEDDDLDNLLSFMEYIINLTNQAATVISSASWTQSNAIDFVIAHLLKICEKINYQFVKVDSIYILSESNPLAIEAAQTISEEKSYLPFQYTHHSLAGDLESKRGILRNLGHELESKRDALKEVDPKLESDLFFCLNNLNIRHNNVDGNSPNHKPPIARMSDDEIEKWYDYTYRMTLVALAKLGEYPGPKQIDELKEEIKSNE